MAKIPVIYLAGPYRATATKTVQEHINHARAIGSALPSSGWIPLIPHSNLSHFDSICPDIDDEFWLDGTLELMRRCDAVMMLDGWQDSVGAVNERDEALRLGMPIFSIEEWPPAASEFLASLNHYDRINANAL